MTLGTVRSLEPESCAESGVALDLETVYREHSEQVSRWLRRLWGPGVGGADLEDLLHEVFLVVQRKLPSFRGEAQLSTFLYAISVRVVNARRRKERWRRLLWRRAEPELVSAAAPTPVASSAFDRSEVARMVYAILDELSERDRTLLVLFEVERLPGQEIARVLELAPSTLWVALSRARTFSTRLRGTLRRSAQGGFEPWLAMSA